jgi:hypothetical protein
MNDPYMQHSSAGPKGYGKMHVYPYSPENLYEAGERITVKSNGFEPGELVSVQLYTLREAYNGKSISPSLHFNQRIGNTVSTTDSMGNTQPKHIHLPDMYGENLAVVSIGHNSHKRVAKRITVV